MLTLEGDGDLNNLIEHLQYLIVGQGPLVRLKRATMDDLYDFTPEDAYEDRMGFTPAHLCPNAWVGEIAVEPEDEV